MRHDPSSVVACRCLITHPPHEYREAEFGLCRKCSHAEEAHMPRTVKGPYLITTSPTLTECHTCHRPVLAATVDGLDRHVDTAMLNNVGELAALLAGRSTYTLIGDQLLVRSPALIGSGRFDGRPVLADHDHTATPDLFVDKVLAPRAVTLIVAAVGGVVVGGRDDAPAPF